MTPKLLCEALIEEAKLSGVQVKTAEIVGMEISGKDVTALKVKVINFLSTLVFKLLVEHEKKMADPYARLELPVWFRTKF